jgi:hypothetical protein
VIVSLTYGTDTGKKKSRLRGTLSNCKQRDKI